MDSIQRPVTGDEVPLKDLESATPSQPAQPSTSTPCSAPPLTEYYLSAKVGKTKVALLVLVLLTASTLCGLTAALGSTLVGLDTPTYINPVAYAVVAITIFFTLVDFLLMCANRSFRGVRPWRALIGHLGLCGHAVAVAILANRDLSDARAEATVGCQAPDDSWPFDFPLLVTCRYEYDFKTQAQEDKFFSFYTGIIVMAYILAVLHFLLLINAGAEIHMDDKVKRMRNPNAHATTGHSAAYDQSPAHTIVNGPPKPPIYA